MPSRATTPSFVVELQLRIGSDVEQVLERTFRLAQCLHNATLCTVLKRDGELRASDAWKAAKAMPKGKERTAEFKRLMESAGLTKNGFEKILLDHLRKSGRRDQIDSNTEQKIADRIWDVYQRWRYENGGKPRYKGKRRGLHSLEGKTNKSGIRWKPDNQCIEWLGCRMLARVDKRDDWLMRALADPQDPQKPRKVKYCRILWRNINERKRWFVQLVCEGTSPVKHVFAPADIKAGIDPSLRSMTCFVEDGTVEKIDISSDLAKSERTIRNDQRRIERKRRSNNPENYDEQGRVKKGPLNWNISKKQRDLEAKLAESHRKAAAHHKNKAGELANWLLGRAGCIHVEKNQFKAFQRSGFGRSIRKGAPRQFITMLKVKAASAGLKVFEVSPRKLRPSQHDIETGEFIKHGLSERWIKLGESGLWINRDAMAALNLLWADESGENYLPPDDCKKHWEAVKCVLLDAGWLVQLEARDEASEIFLRRFRRKDRPALTVGELRQKRNRGRSDDSLAA